MRSEHLSKLLPKNRRKKKGSLKGLPTEIPLLRKKRALKEGCQRRQWERLLRPASSPALLHQRERGLCSPAKAARAR
jgi:hypothetical protein